MTPERVRAVCRMLVASGDMTPYADRMIRLVLLDDEPALAVEVPEYLWDRA